MVVTAVTNLGNCKFIDIVLNIYRIYNSNYSNPLIPRMMDASNPPVLSHLKWLDLGPPTKCTTHSIMAPVYALALGTNACIVSPDTSYHEYLICFAECSEPQMPTELI